jgi:predicted AlkP superfamily pyrophosphatase or phosphodiesterase
MAASTFTPSGLATISTGAYPELHGIVADTWYDRREHKPILAALDKLQGTTLSDEVITAK